MPGARFLEGDEVTLRTVEEDDLQFLREFRNDPRVRVPMTFDGPSNMEGQREFFEGLYEGDDVTLLVCLDGADAPSYYPEYATGEGADRVEPVGNASLFRVDQTAGHGEVAYWTAPKAQGQGYGTDAMAAILDYAFDEKRLHRVRARALTTNDASRALLESLGFVEEGVQRDEKYVQGEYVDTHFYGLLEDEWEGR